MDTDKRFAHIATDPKFRRIPKGARKVKIDKRFQPMFNDNKFNIKYTVDKRGRPVNHSTNEDLKRYYDLSSEGDSPEATNEEEENDETIKEQSESNQSKGTTKGSLKQKPGGAKLIPDDIKNKLKNISVDYARGEGQLFSESSSDDEESGEEEVSDTEQIDHKWGELCNDAEETQEITSRIAACNMDWDRIRAIDLMVLFNSFLHSGGTIESIKIYPSTFGKKRMAEEDVTGPQELTNTEEENDNQSVEGNNFHMEKLRQYQLNRLKYYYAVVTCDNSATANKIYTECDGMEYESSSTKIDLRFIPEDMSFDDRPKEVCDTLPESGKYKPRFFTTTALQQAKVNLTWDETNPDRIEVVQRISSGNVDDISEADLQTYLACSSSGSEDENEENGPNINENFENNEDEKNPIDKYKALLQQIEENEEEKRNKDVEMEVSWGIDLKEKTEKLVKEKLSAKEDKTPFQQYLDKRKEKRKEKRNKKKQDGAESESSDDIPLDVDLNDPYFAEEFDKPEFKGRKSRKSKKNGDDMNSDEDMKRKQGELELLLDEQDPNDKRHFTLKKIQDNETETKSKKKRNKKNAELEKTEDNFAINVQDERFAALYTSHHYNIDPTDPHYKKTKAMETLISEKIKRKNDRDQYDDVNVAAKKSKQKTELSVLVKSVKRKANAFDKSNKKEQK